jgi:nucleoid-associated protein YgaU
MGLLDFAANIGRKIFDREEEGGTAIKSHIEENNPGIEDLNVEVKDGVAVLKGVAANEAAKEKAVLMAGNVQGVKEVRVDDVQLSPEAASASAIEVEFYEIQSGDSLSKIAKQFYGDANKYPQIFEANKEVIQDPDKIFPGQKIRIPKQ